MAAKKMLYDYDILSKHSAAHDGGNLQPRAVARDGRRQQQQCTTPQASDVCRCVGRCLANCRTREEITLLSLARAGSVPLTALAKTLSVCKLDLEK